MRKGFGRFLRHNTIALLALFVALGGTSFAAATLINGKLIKPHTIAKNRLTNTAIKQLKGNRGPQGAQGVRGPTGVQGPAGPFPTGNLPGGNSLRGNWMALCDSNEPTCWTDIAFHYQMASPLAAHYMAVGAPATAACPGSPDNPLAAAGHLCVYESITGGVDHTITDYIYDQDFNAGQSGRWGAEIRLVPTGAAYYYAVGTWAATSPAGTSRAISHASHASPSSVVAPR